MKEPKYLPGAILLAEIGHKLIACRALQVISKDGNFEGDERTFYLLRYKRWGISREEWISGYFIKGLIEGEVQK